ncbi:MAG: sulfite exporter TauE/SafE family protein [bacterium]|nr:sulfite exporter TauE/SafE family protein [bacterium]
MEFQFVAVVAFVALLIGLSKGGLGAVLAVLSTPLLSQVMPVADAISLALPMLIIADLFALRVYWRQWDMHYIRLLLPTSVVGILVGTFMLANLPDDVLRRLLGLFVLFFVGYRLLADRLSSIAYQPRNWHGTVAGFIAGTGSAVANVGGPPFTIYMLLQNIAPLAFVGTTTLYFALVNLIKLPPLVAAGLMDIDVLLRAAWVLPLLPVGVWAGRKVINRINQRTFERLMLIVLSVTAIYLLVAPA